MRDGFTTCPGNGCALFKQFECPPNCSGFWQKCPQRKCLERGPGKVCRKHENVEEVVNRTLKVILPRYPRPTVHPKDESSIARRIILVTTTFPHSLQLLKLEHCKNVLTGVPNTFWIVSEDASTPSAGVAQLLASSGIQHAHLAFGPTKKGGNAQRNQALKYIRRQRLTGIVYNMDDVILAPLNRRSFPLLARYVARTPFYTRCRAWCRTTNITRGCGRSFDCSGRCEWGSSHRAALSTRHPHAMATSPSSANPGTKYAFAHPTALRRPA